MTEEQVITQEEEKPGYFESNIKDYPGYIRFPHPFQLAHVKLWWKTAVEPLKDKTALDWDYQIAEWNAAKEILLAHGEWAIKGVDESMVKNDDVPAIVIKLVTEAANMYIPPFLPSSAQRRLRAVI